jgi:hypothetical protein
MPELPMDQLPEAIAARELEKQLFGDPDAPPASEHNSEEEKPGQEELAPPQPEPQPAPAPETAPEPAEPGQPEPPAPSVDWEQKYKTLDGILAKQQKDELARLRAENEQLRAQRTAPTPEPAKPAGPDKVAELRRQLAECTDPDEQAELIEQLTDELVTRKVGEATRPLQETLTKQQQTETARAAAVYEDRLTQAVPNWQEINRKPEFIEWLGEAGLELIKAHDANLNHERVIKFFKDFEKQTAPPNPPTAPPAPAPPGEDVARAAIAAQAAPRPAPASAPAAAKKTTYTQKQHDALYQRIEAGITDGTLSRDDEAKLREEYFNAMVEGRVR